MDKQELIALAERVEKCTAADNRLDVKVEIALFEPDDEHVSVRANDAGTKLIYTDHGGRDTTYRACDWTMDGARAQTAASLRAIASQEGK